MWPGGTLPVQPRPERSAAEKEETKEQCLNCLMQLLPGTQQLLESLKSACLIYKASEVVHFWFVSLFVLEQSSLLTCWAARSTD